MAETAPPPKLLALTAAGLCALLAPVALLAPKGVVVLLIVATVLSAIAWLQGRRLPWPPRAASLAFALLALWAAASLTWSVAPAEAGLRLLRAMATVGLGLYLHALWQPLDRAARRRALNWLLIGFLFAFSVAVFEALFGFPLLTAIKGETPGPYYDRIRFNRGMAAFAILVWPLAAVLLARGRPWLATGLPLALLPLLLVMESAAAGLAWFIGGAVFAVIMWRPGWWRPLVVCLLVVAAVGALPLAKGLYRAGLADKQEVANNTRYRIHLWNFVADRIMEQPLHGWGFDAARRMPNFDQAPYRSKAAKQADEVAEAGDRAVIPLHPHNAVLELLLDLGAIGLIAAGWFCWVMLRTFGHSEPTARAGGLAAFAAALVVATTAFGLWQSQWLALLALVTVTVMLLYESEQRRPVT